MSDAHRRELKHVVRDLRLHRLAQLQDALAGEDARNVPPRCFLCERTKHEVGTLVRHQVSDASICDECVAKSAELIAAERRAEEQAEPTKADEETSSSSDADAIRARLRESGLSGSKIATLAGVSQPVVSRFLGGHTPKPDTLAKLAAVEHKGGGAS